ncbi:hypothetical protein [Nocardia anaemiae]|nr:hypothetical protein [Nocardia anaemiae]
MPIGYNELTTGDVVEPRDEVVFGESARSRPRPPGGPNLAAGKAIPLDGV